MTKAQNVTVAMSHFMKPNNQCTPLLGLHHAFANICPLLSAFPWIVCCATFCKYFQEMEECVKRTWHTNQNDSTTSHTVSSIITSSVQVCRWVTGKYVQTEIIYHPPPSTHLCYHADTWDYLLLLQLNDTCFCLHVFFCLCTWQLYVPAGIRPIIWHASKWKRSLTLIASKALLDTIQSDRQWTCCTMCGHLNTFTTASINRFEEEPIYFSITNGKCRWHPLMLLTTSHGRLGWLTVAFFLFWEQWRLMCSHGQDGRFTAERKPCIWFWLLRSAQVCQPKQLKFFMAPCAPSATGQQYHVFNYRPHIFNFPPMHHFPFASCFFLKKVFMRDLKASSCRMVTIKLLDYTDYFPSSVVFKPHFGNTLNSI